MSTIDWPAWVRSWPCIDKACDGKGTVCLGVHEHPDGECEYDLHQCQFCDEREMLAKELEGYASKLASCEKELAEAREDIGILDTSVDQQILEYLAECENSGRKDVLLQELQSRLDRAMKMLDELECADCMGAGEVQDVVDRTVPECCQRPNEDGSCCGNAVPGLVQDLVTLPCQWCAERDAIRGRIVENPVTIATDRTNERQTCRHCGNPVPCACW